MIEYNNVYLLFLFFNRFNYVYVSEGGMSKYLVMFKVNIWFFLLDFFILGKYYNDNVILL